MVLSDSQHWAHLLYLFMIREDEAIIYQHYIYIIIIIMV